MDLKLATIVSLIAVAFVVLIGVLGYLMDKSADAAEENRR